MEFELYDNDPKQDTFDEVKDELTQLSHDLENMAQRLKYTDSTGAQTLLNYAARCRMMSAKIQNSND